MIFEEYNEKILKERPEVLTAYADAINEENQEFLREKDLLMIAYHDIDAMCYKVNINRCGKPDYVYHFSIPEELTKRADILNEIVNTRIREADKILL